MASLNSVMRARRRRRLARERALAPIVRPSDVAYRAELIDVSRQTQRLIWSQLFGGERMDADEAPSPGLFRRLFERIRFLIPERTPTAGPIAARMTRDVNRANALAVTEQFSSAGVPIVDVFADAATGPVLRQSLRENVDLIESIPQTLLEDVKETILPLSESGARVEVIKKELKKRFAVSESRAALIARDQVGKLNGQLNQTRQSAAGVRTYTWWCVLDERVRGRPGGVNAKGMHWQLHGKTFSWDDPPITNEDGDRNHPGEDYQCRCQARPNVSALLDQLESGPDHDEE